jgi:hypothetical protein
MRKIESQMCDAVENNKQWRSGNTEVVTEFETSNVYLHGNHIAMIGPDFVTLYDGGFQSNTTKSRLNALCDRFAITGEGVFQKDFTWYVRQYDTESGEFQTVEFNNGFQLR